MPTTAPPSPPPKRLSAADPARLGRIAAGAAAFGAAEIFAAVAIGRFFDWERAEAFLFLAFRPALIFVTVLLAAAKDWRARAGLYGLALALAALAETLLLLRLGAASPWEEMLRGLAGGALLFLLADLVVQAGRRWGGRHGRWLAAIPLVLLLALPGAMQPYQRLIEQAPARIAAGQKPKLMLMTGLPLVWGEAGPFDPNSRPAVAYQALQEEFEIELLDTLDPRTLSGKLLLLAHPQRLSPGELAALDSWVRCGGRAVILTDPQLIWPSELPIGDIRRPPPVGLLGPLLDHWGLELLEPAERAQVAERWKERRVVLDAPGSFRATGKGCAASSPAWMARCKLGAGEAILAADADLMRDDLWAPLGPERSRRIADNPLLVADWLDELAGIRRSRSGGNVAWASPDANRATALGLAMLPILIAGVGGLLLKRRRRG